MQLVIYGELCILGCCILILIYWWLECNGCGVCCVLKAVVVSIDPRRVYVNSPAEIPYKTIELQKPGKCPFFVTYFTFT